MGEGASWLGAKEVAELEGDLPEMCALGTSSMGIPPGAGEGGQSWGVSSQQQSPRGEGSGHTVAPADPNACCKAAALPAPLHGLEMSGSCSPFPTGTRWGAQNPGRGGCGRDRERQWG